MNSLVDLAWRVPGLSTLEKSVLVRLADRADASGLCWPSQSAIARDCSATDRGVRNAISALVEAGHLQVAEPATFTKSARYRVTPRAEQPPQGPEPSSPPEITSGPEPSSFPSGTHFRGVRKSLPPNPHITPKEPSTRPPSAGTDERPEQTNLLQVEAAPVLKSKPTRRRDECFDALAQACGSNPDGMTKQEAKAAAVALAGIRGASPDVTPAEIARRVANYRRANPTWTCTPQAVAKHWSRLAADAPRSREDLEAAIARHPANPESVHFRPEDLTPKQREELAQLRAQLHAQLRAAR